MSRIEKVTLDTFEERVIGAEPPVLVAFTVSDCPACHDLRPKLEELAAEYEDRARIVEVNVDEEETLGDFFRIRAVPTLAFFKEGEPMDSLIGSPAPSAMRRVLDQLVGSWPWAG